MEAGSAGTPRRRFGDVIRALFGEAQARKRRRRRRQLLVVLVICGAAAGAGFALSAGTRGPSNTPTGANGHRIVPIRNVAARDQTMYALGAVPTLHQLLANFAVLRRPQTAVDRSWKPNCDCGRSARQLSSLTRHAVTLPGGDRVFLDVQQLLTSGSYNMSKGSYVMNLNIVGRQGDSSSEPYGPNTQFSLSPIAAGGPRAILQHQTKGGQLMASVVPDGVARVSWRFEFDCPPALKRRIGCTPQPPKTVTVPVVDNIAARELPDITNYPMGARARDVTWFGRNGHVLARFDGYGNLPAAPFVTGRLGTGKRSVLTATGVGDARLGQASTAVIASLTKLLGPPADANAAVANCGIDHESVWTSPAAADPLTIYQRDGRFVGYQYGAPVSQIGLVRGPGAVLTTDRGLTIGDRFGAAKRLYATGVATHAAAGVGSWSATTRTGTLKGVVLPNTYPLRSVTAANKLATIGAGDTGCRPTAH